MPFDGSGNFNRVMNWVSDAAANIKIRADRHDQEDDNLASGLSNTLTKDGQSQPTADIPMNGKKLINLAAPTDPTDAATKGYADSLRSFNTAINLTGPVPQARIGFTQADIGFGARVAGTPVGMSNRWVWNDEPDLSGNDVAILSENGTLAILGGYNFNVMSSLAMSAGFAGFLTFDKAAGTLTYSRTAASVAAGAAATPVPQIEIDANGNFCVTRSGQIFGAGATGNGLQLWARNATDTATGPIVALRGSADAGNPSGLDFYTGTAGAWGVALRITNNKSAIFLGSITAETTFQSSSALAILAPTGAGTAYLRPNGAGSAVGQFYVDSAGNARASSWVISGNGVFNSATASLVVSTTGAGNVLLRPNGAGSAAGQTFVASDGSLNTNGNVNIGSAAGASIVNFKHANGTVQMHIDYIDAFPAMRFYRGAQQTYWDAATNQWTFPGQCAKPGGGEFADSSDERIKTVVGEYESGLAEVRSLHPVVYTFKGNDTPYPPGLDLANPEAPMPMVVSEAPYPNSDHYQVAVDGTQFVGFIAQEVEAVMPGMVTSVDGYIDGEAVTDLKKLDTSNLIFAVVNAVKELADRVEQLEAA